MKDIIIKNVMPKNQTLFGMNNEQPNLYKVPMHTSAEKL